MAWLLFHSWLERVGELRGGGGVRLKLDLQDQGGGNILDVDGYGGQ